MDTFGLVGQGAQRGPKQLGVLEDQVRGAERDGTAAKQRNIDGQGDEPTEHKDRVGHDPQSHTLSLSPECGSKDCGACHLKRGDSMAAAAIAP